VPQVVADHHDPAVAADHLALVADLLDARLDLHGRALLLCVVYEVRTPVPGLGVRGLAPGVGVWGPGPQ